MKAFPNNREDLGEELPHGDQMQVLLLILFLSVWIADSFIWHLSTFLAAFVPLVVRLALAGVSLGLGFLLMGFSHKAIFRERRDFLEIIDTGVYAWVRHPMYLGSLLVYAGFFLSTLSLVSLGVGIGIFALYDKMATYEENNLTERFGSAYVAYKQRVAKWFPKASRF